MSTRVRRLLMASMAILSMIAFSLVTPTSAHALSGTTVYSYDDTDPYATGCAGAYARKVWSQTLYTRGVIGTLEVWYSTRCGTNWIRTYNPASSTWSKKAVIRPRLASDPVDKPVVGGGGMDWGRGWSWSNQIYSPGTSRIYGAAEIGIPVWTGSFDQAAYFRCDTYCTFVTAAEFVNAW